MSQHAFYQSRFILQGDTGPVIELSVQDQDGATAINLTGYAAWVTFWIPGSATPKTIGQGYIFDAANGLARYQPSSTDQDTAGDLAWQWTLMDPNGFESSSPEFRRSIIAKVGT